MNQAAINQIGKDIATLAKTLFKKYAQQAETDGNAFWMKTKQEVEKWLQQLENKAISKKNFQSLVRGESNLAEMEALKQAGLAQVSIDTFIQGVIDIIINAALASKKI
jgi:hypothetical protein